MFTPYRMTCIMILLCAAFLLPSLASAQEHAAKEKQRMEQNARFDKMKLREKTDFVVDNSDKFLQLPADAKEKPAGEYIVAKVSPTCKLRIVPDMKPEYFTDEGVQYMAGWAIWGHVTRSEDNRFYFSVGDHKGMGCQLNLYEYCPARNLLHRVLDVSKLLGWTDKTYTDGKIHGYMRIMPDGTLWAATHFGAIPDSSWYANGFRGSWLLSYNIFTHEAKNWGNPMAPSNYPCFNVDTRRGRMVANGDFGTILCWDTIGKKVLYAGCPPEGWVWWDRTMFLDEETGIFWSVEGSSRKLLPGHDKTQFLSYDPEFNRFLRYDVSPPENPYTHKVDCTRGFTDSPAMDGWYYMTTQNGVFFKFKPLRNPTAMPGVPGEDVGWEKPYKAYQNPLVESAGTTWDKGRDVLQLALDPSGRYVYYYPKGDAPIVQYDVKTGKKKALCWLQDYYFDKYGYFMGEVYGMNISNDGSFLVFAMNGEFCGKGNAFGHPAILVVEIPPEERP
ncbi:hypothetical protein LLG96_14940 [bacterium]|nr:hypothetical protein [bacterium]